MYHILASQRHPQYGAIGRYYHPTQRLAFHVQAAPPSLVQLAIAVLRSVGGMEQKMNIAASGRIDDPVGAEQQCAGPQLEAEPVQRSAAQAFLDARRQVGGD